MQMLKSWLGKILFIGLAAITVPTGWARARTATAQIYHNPILFADYSDPDVIRVGREYYMVSSSFYFVPGITILKSDDLVHWTIVGHVVQRLTMSPRYSMIGGNRYGGGVWAPSIRRHDGLFYVYFPTPNEGIFVSTASNITGPWSKPTAVIAQSGLEDPCPFWDSDGRAYLIHSRVGAGPLILNRMSPDGWHVLDSGRVIVDNPQHLPTLEGPKLYKRDGYYYIFAPFGGVQTGSEAVLRARHIYGPWKYRVVLAQGDTHVNGPHQGAYVETPDGQGWFVHFQAHAAHGRIVYLEPVHWSDGWPIIGKSIDGSVTGEPVAEGPMPDGSPVYSLSNPPLRPQTSDEFNSTQLGLQWQWSHNPDNAHWSLTARPGFLRLIPMRATGLLTARNTLTQMMQDNSFEFTIRMDLSGMKPGAHAGLAMFGKFASGLQVVDTQNVRRLNWFHLPLQGSSISISGNVLELRVKVDGNTARYSYSMDHGRSFHRMGQAVQLRWTWWKAPRPALFAWTTSAADPGVADFDWAHYRCLGTKPL